MNHDYDRKRESRSSPARGNRFQPLTPPPSSEGSEEAASTSSYGTYGRVVELPSETRAPLKMVSSGSRRGPSYPAWEKPPSPYTYPRLRGSEEHRPWIPITLALTGVAIAVVVLVIIPALFGHGGNIAAASGSARPSASVSGEPAANASASASAALVSPSATPTPNWTYRQYTVISGDSVSKIAKKFGLQQWELLVANPTKIVNGVVRLGSVLQIPPAGVLTPPPSATPTPSAT
jgi:LysM repeat protein